MNGTHQQDVESKDESKQLIDTSKALHADPQSYHSPTLPNTIIPTTSSKMPSRQSRLRRL
jgi:hypothetical protein